MPRGRPPEADPKQISAVALKLFERKGFDAVTMDDVARAAKVSRRTLFRLFPSKADLVWDGMAEVVAGVKGHVPSGRSLSEVLDEVFGVGLAVFEDAAGAEQAMRKLRLIAASPGLLGHPAIQAVQDVLTGVVAAHRKKNDPPAELIGSAIFAVGFSTVLWWVRHPRTMTVRAALRAALEALPRGAR